MMSSTNKPLDPFCRPLKNLVDAQTMVFEIQEFVSKRKLTLRPPPPTPSTCCGRGCNGCVWEGYFEALNYWRDQARDLLR
ncbi:oxidoreductase-like domain-containing protein [Propionivibrio sp.]|uniref:oxidoreductase-like domain-containing protein n=1 Tax=Propionivibrio sp. TaxID=2212460 RepID=UPI003BF2ABFB